MAPLLFSTPNVAAESLEISDGLPNVGELWNTANGIQCGFAYSGSNKNVTSSFRIISSSAAYFTGTYETNNINIKSRCDECKIIVTLAAEGRLQIVDCNGFMNNV